MLAPQSHLQSPSPEDVARALDAVYTRPEFAPVSVSPLFRWLDTVRTRIGELFADLFRAAGADERLARHIVIGILIVAGTALGVSLVRTALAAWRARERSNGRPSTPVTAATDRADADTWEARSRSAAAAGRWREAVLALYPALVLRLDAAGLLLYDPSKTPGDYRREARREPVAMRVLEAFLPRFEPVAFGGRPADAATYEALRMAAAISVGGKHDPSRVGGAVRTAPSVPSDLSGRAEDG